jgi:hypothetical protein
MPKFRAIVRLSGIEAADAASVPRTVEEQLKAAGLSRWRVLRVHDEDAPRRRRLQRLRYRRRWRSRREGTNGLLIVAASAWAIWFFWMFSE